MHTFAKISGFEEWFLIAKSFADVEPFAEKMDEWMEACIKGRFSKALHGEAPGENLRTVTNSLRIVRENPPSAVLKTCDYGHWGLAVRRNGARMPFNCVAATEIFTTKEAIFPSDVRTAEILICENDGEPEPHWLRRLQFFHPEAGISTIPFFRHRQVAELLPLFRAAKYITFSTTFTSLDWFELLLDVFAEGGLTGKVIEGMCGGYRRGDWRNLLQETKLGEVIAAGNEFRVVDYNKEISEAIRRGDNEGKVFWVLQPAAEPAENV